MDKVGSRLIIFSSQREDEEMDYAMNWHYLNSYLETIISNLDLFKKVVNGKPTLEELLKWYSIFYGKLTKNDRENLDLIFSIKPEEKERDYQLYREFVLEELNKYSPLLSMHLSSANEAVRSLNMTNKRINNIMKNEVGE